MSHQQRRIDAWRCNHSTVILDIAARERISSLQGYQGRHPQCEEIILALVLKGTLFIQGAFFVTTVDD